ncbi:Mitochondrial carrier -like protein 2 [Trichinella pseudospiralis]|uniref:Mitochondrial carrier-like protein 2 n=1 Tax=Trichinella pseudospiralis TaxID=6337 RepID=A0A0V1JUG1_TRIPS|nr:Mitochondrial carrier -like protein 2 [Trichinella pseudospiralis]
MTPDEQTFKTQCYVKISLDISSKCAETAFALNMNSETRKKLIENSHEHQSHYATTFSITNKPTMNKEEFSELNSTDSYGSFLMRIVNEKRQYNVHPCIFIQSFVTYPISMTKILCQLGFEPLPLEVGTALFSKTVEKFSPNYFAIMKYLWKTKGFWSLYIGVDLNLIHLICERCVSYNVLKCLDKADPGKTNDRLCLLDYAYFLKQSNVSCTFAIALLCRTVAQLIFDENKYTGSVFRRFWTAYEETGFRGFFSGIVAELIGEMCFLWISAHILRYLRKMILEQSEIKKKVRRTELIFPAFATFLIPRILKGKFYPFHLVATIMAVNGSSLKVANPPFYPIFDRWQNCYAYMDEIKQFDRGRKMFNRVYKGAYESLNGKLYALPY